MDLNKDETPEFFCSEVVALGETMVGEQHRAAPEVQEKITAVLAERQKLHTAWQHKKVTGVLEYMKLEDLFTP